MFLKKMKEDLKVMAAEIRSERKAFRERQSEFGKWKHEHYPVYNVKYGTPEWKEYWERAGKVGYARCSPQAFRTKHIAYCLLRGRAYEQIEPKVRDGNGPRWDLIDKIVADGKVILAQEKEAYDAAQAVRASAG